MNVKIGCMLPIAILAVTIGCKNQTQYPNLQQTAVPAASSPMAGGYPIDQSKPNKSGGTSGLIEGTSFKADGTDGSYLFTWGHALHELMEPPTFSLGKLDPEADPDSELQTTHLDYYLLHRPKSEQNGMFTFDFGEYERLKPDEKALVQGFCIERLRILQRAWPDVDEQHWRQGGWYEYDAPRPAGKPRPVCK